MLELFGGALFVFALVNLWDKWKTTENGLEYEPYFRDASAKRGLPSGLLSRVAYVESRYNPRAVSPAGAVGLMQFMPETARGFGIDPYNPVDSIYAAAAFLADLYQQFGTWEKALAAYNWGPGNLTKYGLARAPKETRDYIAAILGAVNVA